MPRNSPRPGKSMASWLDRLEGRKPRSQTVRGGKIGEEQVDARWAQMEAGIRPAPSRLWPPMMAYTSELYSDVRVYDATGQLIRIVSKAELDKIPHMPKDWVGSVETWKTRKHRKGKYAVLSPEQHGPELSADAFRD